MKILVEFSAVIDGPKITLGVYGHLLQSTDSKAAQVIADAFGKTLTE
jgi:hypothetical protein